MTVLPLASPAHAPLPLGVFTYIQFELTGVPGCLMTWGSGDFFCKVNGVVDSTSFKVRGWQTLSGMAKQCSLGSAGCRLPV